MQEPSAHQEIPPNADVLARVYIDAIAEAENVKIKPMLAPQRDDAVDDFLQSLETSDDADSPHLRVDLVLAAVLTASMIASEPDLAHRLRHHGPVVVVKTHTSELVEQLDDVFTECATSGKTIRKLILSRDGTDKTKPDRAGRDVSSALSNRWPVIGIAPDPKRHLPSALLRMAQYQLSLPEVDE